MVYVFFVVTRTLSALVLWLGLLGVYHQGIHFPKAGPDILVVSLGRYVA